MARHDASALHHDDRHAGRRDAAVAIDDAACALYEAAGIALDFPPGHPLLVAERATWTACAAAGRLIFAVDRVDGVRAGFIVLSARDGAAHLEQIAVLPGHMRRGLGRRLLDHAVAWGRREGYRALWLTTYDHLPWNRPWYERQGFAVVPEAAWGADVALAMALHRAHLPEPDKRVAMRRRLYH